MICPQKFKTCSVTTASATTASCAVRTYLEGWHEAEGAVVGVQGRHGRHALQAKRRVALQTQPQRRQVA
jgi:hypothetical protein